MLQELGDDMVLQPLSLRMVKRMGDELIRLCDGIERHGLVDYQFGVWEDEIESCKRKRHLPPKKVDCARRLGEFVH